MKAIIVRLTPGQAEEVKWTLYNVARMVLYVSIVAQGLIFWAAS